MIWNFASALQLEFLGSNMYLNCSIIYVLQPKAADCLYECLYLKDYMSKTYQILWYDSYVMQNCFRIESQPLQPL